MVYKIIMSSKRVEKPNEQRAKKISPMAALGLLSHRRHKGGGDADIVTSRVQKSVAKLSGINDQASMAKVLFQRAGHPWIHNDARIRDGNGRIEIYAVTMPMHVIRRPRLQASHADIR